MDRQVWKLARRPEGDIADGDLEFQTEPAPQPAEGEALVEVIYLSLDPTNRIWMSDREQYLSLIHI